MIRRFGKQTITFVSITEDVTDLDRYGNPALIRTPTDVPRCRFRPMTSAEDINEIGDLVKDPWKATCPPVPAVLNAKATDEIVVGGVTYQIAGMVRPTVDMAGNPFKVTVIAQRITG